MTFEGWRFKLELRGRSEEVQGVAVRAARIGFGAVEVLPGTGHGSGGGDAVHLDWRARKVA
jgi:hypothetical protein